MLAAVDVPSEASVLPGVAPGKGLACSSFSRQLVFSRRVPHSFPPLCWLSPDLELALFSFSRTGDNLPCDTGEEWALAALGKGDGQSQFSSLTPFIFLPILSPTEVPFQVLWCGQTPIAVVANYYKPHTQ